MEWTLRRATIALAAWAALVALLAPEAAVLGEKLVYDEKALLPGQAESVRGLDILLEELNWRAGDFMAVVYSPPSLEASREVEELLREVFPEASIVGPYSAYTAIIEAALGNASSAVEEAVAGYERLLGLGGNLSRAYRDSVALLNATYGLAEAFIGAYTLSLLSGGEDPASEAFQAIYPRIPEEYRWWFSSFYEYFREYSARAPLVQAADRAVKEASEALGEAGELVKAFNITSYRNETLVLEFIAGKALETLGPQHGLSVAELMLLARSPEDGALRIVYGKLRDASPCLARAFEEAVSKALDSTGIRRAVREACAGEIAGVLQYPDSIPEGLRERLVGGERAVVYVYLPYTIGGKGGGEAIRRITGELSERGIREVSYYGSIPLFSDLLDSANREIRKIDVATSILVVILLVALLRGVGAPLVILAATLMALVVSMGVLSLAAELTSVYYLARLVSIPVIFGVTVDYSVFYVFRVREELAQGASWAEAVSRAWRRAGRALVLGGVSVVLGFAAYMVSPSEALRGIGVALVIASAISFLSSYTLLPALLLVLGERVILWPRGLAGDGMQGHVRVLRRLAVYSLRWRLPIAAVTLAAVGALIVALSAASTSGDLRLALPPESLYLEGERAYLSEFPISTLSTLILILPGDAPAEEVKRSLLGHSFVSYVSVESSGPYTILVVGVNYNPLSDRVFEAVREVRSTVSSVWGGEYYVTGLAALRSDTLESISRVYFTYTLPLALLLIVAYISLGLGSIIVPLRLVVTIAFSACASLAATIVVFGTLYGASLYWIVPIIVVGLMITLGMDYDIFLTTRIREEMERRGQADAIVVAVERTGLVITIVGLILAGAFGALTISGITALRQVGFSIALSILIDTFIVRPILVPSIMAVAGRYNWWPGRGLIKSWD